MATRANRGLVKRDHCAGGLMVVIGLFAVLQGKTYQIGSLQSMGAGFFPVAIGIFLMAIGSLIIGQAKAVDSDGVEEAHKPEWRGWSCIILSIVAFIALGKYGGLVPATFALVFIAAMGDRNNTVISSLMLALVMVAIAVVIFWWLLQMHFPLFGWGFA
jgi:Tripartite tricarboxylate transporter TctB family